MEKQALLRLDDGRLEFLREFATEQRARELGPSQASYAQDVLDLIAEIDRLRPLAEKWQAYERMAFCQCCGAFRANCVCFGGSKTTLNGVVESYSCSPRDHGR